jgi:hypothetical protein
MGLDGRNVYDSTTRVTLAGNRAQPLQTVSLPLERIKSDLFILDLAIWRPDGDLLAINRYLFSKTENLAPILSGLPQTRLRAKVEKNGKTWIVALENVSDQAALGVWIEADKADLRSPGYAYLEDNYFSLLPGEQREVRVKWYGIVDENRLLRVSGWNFPVEKVD